MLIFVICELWGTVRRVRPLTPAEVANASAHHTAYEARKRVEEEDERSERRARALVLAQRLSGRLPVRVRVLESLTAPARPTLLGGLILTLFLLFCPSLTQALP